MSLNSWQAIALGEILTSRQEAPSALDLESGGVRVIAKIGFNDGKIHLRTGGDTKTGMILIRPGDLVISGINAAKGAIAIYDTDAVQPIAATIHYSAYIPNERFDLRFLWYLLRSEAFRNSLIQNLAGGIKSELKPRIFLSVPVLIPSLPEQQRIVARIEELARRVEEARGLRDAGSEEAASLLSSALRVIFSDRSKFQEEDLEDSCNDIIDNLHSNPTYSDIGTIPCIRSQDVGWGELFLNKAAKTTEDEYQLRTRRGEPTEDDIVFVREGGGTGKAALVKNGQRLSLGQRVMMIRPNKEKVNPKYFLYQLLSPSIYEEQIVPLQTGSASPHLNIASLRKFRFRLCQMNEQLRIVSYLDGLQHKVDELRRLQAATQKELDALMPSILAKAFAGEL